MRGFIEIIQLIKQNDPSIGLYGVSDKMKHLDFFYGMEPRREHAEQFWKCCDVISNGMRRLEFVQNKNTAGSYARLLKCEKGIFLAAAIYNDVEYKPHNHDAYLALRKKIRYKMIA